MAKRPIPARDITKVNFVTSAILMGCIPPWAVVVEFAKAPTLDLLMLLMAPDAVDIGQAIIQPHRGRSTKSGRRGRKGRRRPNFPDVSDIIGQRARAAAGIPAHATELPFRRLFWILNAYELVQITAAILDGVADIGYETMIGYFTIDPSSCTDVVRFQRTQEGEQTGGGGPPPFVPVGIDDVIFNNGYTTTSISCHAGNVNSYVSVQAQFTSQSATNPYTGAMALTDGAGNILHQGASFTVFPGEWIDAGVSGDIDPNVGCVWGMVDHMGFAKIRNAQALGIQDPFGWIT